MHMGLECEVPYLSREHAATITNGCKIDVHDDGSIRNENYCIDDVPILPMRRSNGKFIYPSGSQIRDRFGAELVTTPYEYLELRQYAQQMASMLGHIPTTPRASIHVHVDIADKSWRYVQNLVRWFVTLEAPLFRISALTEAHRGKQIFFDPEHGNRPVEQDHNYARPLTDSIGIKQSRLGLVPLINIDNLLSANTASAFIAAWGRMDRTWGSLTRYCPHRLHALNLVPLQTYHTVEWRLFNGKYRYMPIVLDIIHALHQLADSDTPDRIEPMPLGTEPSFSAQDMSKLLSLNIEKVWGHSWVKGCATHALASHYRGDDFEVHSYKTKPIEPIFNNVGEVDAGSDSFVFGDSKHPRGLRAMRAARNDREQHNLMERMRMAFEERRRDNPQLNANDFVFMEQPNMFVEEVDG